MSTSMGFRYLYEAGHIEKEIEIWFHVSIVMFIFSYLLKTGEIGAEPVVCRRH
jgi:hypothetical protein